MSTTTSLQDAYVTRTVDALLADGRVAAAWMKGSLATGRAGRYSDVDLGVAVYDEHYESFYADRIQLLKAIGPLVGVGKASVGKRVTVALFADSLEFDLTIDPLSATETYGPEIGWLLFDRTEQRIVKKEAEAFQSQPPKPHRAREVASAFWLRAPRMRRWMAQADLHRAGNELQVGRNWLVELMLIANCPDRSHRVQRDSFILLSPRQWEQLGDLYVLKDFTPRSVADCMVRLIDAISEWGRAACARQGCEYPEELESVARSAVFDFYETVFGSYREGEKRGGENGRER